MLEECNTILDYFINGFLLFSVSIVFIPDYILIKYSEKIFNQRNDNSISISQNKTMIINSETVATESNNFTNAAETKMRD